MAVMYVKNHFKIIHNVKRGGIESVLFANLKTGFEWRWFLLEASADSVWIQRPLRFLSERSKGK